MLSGCSGNDGTTTDTTTSDDEGGGDGGEETTTTQELGEQLGPYTYYNNPENYNTARHDAINLVVEQLNQLGLDVGVEVLEWGTLFSRAFGNAEFDFVTWRTPFGIDPLRVLILHLHPDNASVGDGNFTQYENERVGELLDAQTTAETMDERVDTLHEFQGIIAEDNPMAPMVDMVTVLPYNNGTVEGWTEHIQGFDNMYNMVRLEINNDANALRGVWSESIESLNPFKTWITKNRRQFWLLYDFLVQLTPELEPDTELSLATDINRPDLETLEATIREGHTFHDGEPLTAEDVAFSYNYLVEKEPPARGEAQRLVDNAEVVDDTTVRINFSQEVGVVVHPLITSQVPIVPKHVWEGVDSPSQQNVEEPVGSGPFELDYWDVGSELSLAVNPDHWTSLDFEKRVWRIIPESSTVWELLERGELDYLPFGRISRQLQSGEQKDAISVAKAPGNALWHSSMHTTVDGLDQVEVRQAVADALPKTAVVDQLLYGYPNVGQSIIPSGFGPLHTSDLPEYGDDVEGGKQRLEDAGFVYDDEGMVHFPAE